MNQPTECILLDDPPQAGPWNMAVDEALLEWSAATDTAAMRFYRWAKPTLSLGYFQSYATRAAHAASRGCPAVRRLTGGGAILHDAELTYSLAVPARHPLAARRETLYETVHGALVETLAAWGVAARLCEGSARRRPQDEPFLCFQRRAPGDVISVKAGAEGLTRLPRNAPRGATGAGVESKIAGSAQRRRRGAVVQHGSVLLSRSAFAPELPGLDEFAGQPVLSEALTAAWLGVLADRLGFRWIESRLTDDVERRATALVALRYAAADWTQQRTGTTIIPGAADPAG